MQAALSLRSMRLYADPVSGSCGWSGSGWGRARIRYPTRGMSPARPRGHGRQSVPLLSASALSRSILLRACQFSEFPKLLLLFWALCRLFALFALYLRLDGTICANGGFHPTRQQETMRFVSRGRSSGQTACTNSTYRVLGSCCKAPQADPAIPYTDKYPCIRHGCRDACVLKNARGVTG